MFESLNIPEQYRERCEKHLVKRVIGLPNSAVEQSETVNMEGNSEQKQDELTPWLVPPKMYFVKGDAAHSLDSIQWGAIRLPRFVGIVILKLSSKTLLSEPEDILEVPFDASK